MVHYDIPTSGDKCSQCGMIHPPVKPGERCPLAAEVTSSGIAIDFNKFFSLARSELTSIASDLEVKDPKKFLEYILKCMIEGARGYKE